MIMSERVNSLPAAERRRATVEAVVALAAQRNPSDITTAAIAQHMGLTQGALFRHFPSKDAILEAVIGWVAEQLLQRVDEAARKAPTPLAALQAVFMAHIDFVATHPGVPRMVFGELQKADDTLVRRQVRALVQRYGQRVGRLLRNAQAVGELAPGLDLDAAATVFIGTIQGLVMQSLTAPGAAFLRRAAPGAFAIYRRGIGSAP